MTSIPSPSPSSRGRHTSLRHAREHNPPLSAVEALRRSFQMALLGAVSTADIASLAGALKERALAGDLKAMRLLLDLVLPTEAAVQVQQAVAVERQAPCPYPPGSEGRIRILQARAEAGEPLFRPDDAGYDAPLSMPVLPLPNGDGHTIQEEEEEDSHE